MKRPFDGDSEENHEDLRTCERGCVHWHMKKLMLAILRKIIRISGL
jgi:hypothetical protein